MKRIICLLLAVLMALSLCACGEKEPADPNHFDFGKYSVDYKGACIMYSESGDDAVVLNFVFTNNSKEAASYGWTVYEKAMQDGVEMESVYVITDMETYEGVSNNYFIDIDAGNTIDVGTAYKLNGMSEVTVTLSDLFDKYTYTITVDPSTLERVENEYSSWDDWDWDTEESDTEDEELDNSDAELASPEVEAPVEEVSEPSFTDWWAGDWYGWWGIRSASGAYEEINGYWWDACAVLDIGEPAEDSEYNATLTMWDEDGSRTDGLIGEIEVTLSPYGVGEHGTMYSESGSFMDDVLEHADWIIDPGLEDVDNLITIDGEYSGEEGSYSYMVILRPWGTMWDDLDESSLPYTYDSWYLPLIINGASMPDSLSQDVSDEGSTSSVEPEAEPEPSEATVAAPSGEQVPFTVEGQTSNETPFTFECSLPEGVWDMETYMFAYNLKIHNCPDGDDVPWDTPFIWIQFYDNEEKLNFDSPNYENLSETEGRTIDGIEMQGRKYDRFGYEQMQEYYGVLPSGIGVSIRFVKVPDSLLTECYAILDTFSFS